MTPAKDRVSASRVSALWEEHRYWTRRMLWEYTAHERQPDSGPAQQRARSGRALEAAVLAMASEDLGAEVQHLPQGRAAYIRHPVLPLGCVADGYVLHPERGAGLVSAKAVSNTAWFDRWAPMQHGVPRDVEIQLQAELVVWSAAELPEPVAHLPRPTWGCIAAMHDLDLHLFEREAEPGFAAAVETELAAFFESIEAEDPPSLEYTAAELPLALELWPWRGREFLIKDAEDEEAALEAIDLLARARERRKAATDDEGEAKVRILELADGHQLLRTVGWECKVTHSQTKASTKPCPSCGTEVETRRAGATTRFTPKEI